MRQMIFAYIKQYGPATALREVLEGFIDAKEDIRTSDETKEFIKPIIFGLSIVCNERDSQQRGCDWPPRPPAEVAL